MRNMGPTTAPAIQAMLSPPSSLLSLSPSAGLDVLLAEGLDMLLGEGPAVLLAPESVSVGVDAEAALNEAADSVGERTRQ